jgi:hypothetical protein
MTPQNFNRGSACDFPAIMTPHAVRYQEEFILRQNAETIFVILPDPANIA